MTEEIKENTKHILTHINKVNRHMLQEIFTAINDVDVLVAIAEETTHTLVMLELRELARENCDHSVGICYCKIAEVLDRRVAEEALRLGYMRYSELFDDSTPGDDYE